MKSLLRNLVARSDPPSAVRSVELVTTSPTASHVERTVDEAAAHATAGRFGESLAMIDAALAERPGDIGLQIARGNTLLAWGRHREAFRAFKGIEAFGPKSSSFYQKFGLAAFWTSELEHAERCMHLALTGEPENWERHFGFGMVLQAEQKHEEAAACFRRALELEPDQQHCLANLVSCELDLGNYERAESLARGATAVYPKSAIAWSNLGVILDRQCRFEEALAAFDRAAVLSIPDGDDAASFLAHVICLLRAARIQEGIGLLERKLPDEPSVQAHCHYSLALLLSGRFREGWEQYEFRWIEGPLREARPNFVKPAWIGQDLAGKTILLRSEQGFGDFFQFIRYARYVKALGATVHLQLHEAVREVARSAVGVDHILKADEPYPPFDYYVHLLSLPRIFDSDTATIPADVPYLNADPLRTAKWRERFRAVKGLKVGLAWAGSPTHLRDRFRSLPFEALAPLRMIGEVTFYSLQKGPAAADARSANAALDVIDLESELHDFADTAALIQELDLVVCVDTAVAHLAGALGKPVWTMIPSFCDWRWLADRDDSVWYPSMRLFRQTDTGDWATVIAKVHRALNDVAAGRDRLTDYSGASARQSPSLHPRALMAPNPKLACATYTRIGFLQYFADDVVGRSLRQYGEYLQPQIDLVTRFIGPGSTVVEVGAGIGVHAIVLGRTLGTSGDLFLYESRERIAAVLRQNMGANDITNATFMKRIPAGFPGMDDPIGAAARRDALGGSGETIDELRLERLSLLKIAEAYDPVVVISGAGETLWRLRPYVFGAVASDDECVALASRVSEFGYCTWAMKTPLFSPRNFNQVDHDVFSGSFALAVFAVPEEIEMDVTLDHCTEMP